jgi:3-deoxy-D-manno-octulosonic-acid transferase
LERRHPQGLDQRKGCFAPDLLDRLGGVGPIWFHAVSVGEVQAAYPVVEAALEAGYAGPVLLSTTTVTGAQMAERLLGDRVIRIYAPFDVPEFVASALAALRPALFVAFETEIWPNLLSALRRAGIPALLANGRVSDRTYGRARPFAPIWRRILDRFDLLLVREEEDRRRFASFGFPGGRIRVTGDCKVDALFRRMGRVDPEKWRERIGFGGADFLAGSTHAGEEEIVLEAFSAVRAKCPDARLILAPRHPERAEELLPLCGRVAGSCLLSRIRPGWSILLPDRVGVLFELYSLARAAFVGGSLVPKGGQNLMEPAVFGVPVQHGPHMEDFAAPAAVLASCGGARVVRTAAELAEEWGRYLPSPEGNARRDRVVSALRGRFEGDRGAAGRTWSEIARRIGGQ